MGDLADGDLTVRAQVTEDITGAIADSMNYTIDELRTLVAGVNNAAIQVTQKTAQAQSISAELLGAAERQSKEIEETTAQVLQVSRSIADVSSTAEEGARVAQRSLAAADKGRAAVQNSISGMNDIREQIQETSKRIKRLGESSQEIGEIVELISDITEQTNVLALNAAIQAASAGEAGRGFSVVAEEVQRLAERSGEATKQIGAIVKTIQADTQDAVAAMEKSTQGVVEGAKLSDAAGQALSEIDLVTKNLAQLIQHDLAGHADAGHGDQQGRAEHAGHPRDHAADDARHAAGGGLDPRPRRGGAGAEELGVGLQAVRSDVRNDGSQSRPPISTSAPSPGSRPRSTIRSTRRARTSTSWSRIRPTARRSSTSSRTCTRPPARSRWWAWARPRASTRSWRSWSRSSRSEDAAQLPGAIAVAKKGISALSAYLDTLLAGQPDQPMRLLAPYLELNRARGASDANEGDLFFPNLAAELPALPAERDARRRGARQGARAPALAVPAGPAASMLKGARRAPRRCARCTAPSSPSNRCRRRTPNRAVLDRGRGILRRARVRRPRA